MDKFKISILLIVTSLFLVACAEKEPKRNDTNYEETKKMLVDILKSDEGKEALNDILADENFKQHIIMDQVIVKEAIQETLLSEESKEYWKKQLDDPKFAEAFAKSTQEQHETLIKALMNDPEYQQKLMTIMQNPEMEKRFVTLMSSDQFRSHLQERIAEAFENPIFRAEIYNLITKAVTEQQKGKEDEEQEKEKEKENTGDSE